jgi:hypothetical protein
MCLAFIDFIGSTTEIKIIDFLIENQGFEYNQSEISECAGISRTLVNQKLPEMIYNGIIKVAGTRGNAKLYQLADTPFVKKLISVAFAQSFYVAEKEEEEEEAIECLRIDVGPVSFSENLEYICCHSEYEDYKKEVKYSPSSVQNSGDNESGCYSWRMPDKVCAASA